MFDFGFWELLTIGVVALLVVGPERLPAAAAFAGRWLGRIRRQVNHVRNEIQRELDAENLKGLVEDQGRELESLREQVDAVRRDTEVAFERTTSSGLAGPSSHPPDSGADQGVDADTGGAREEYGDDDPGRQRGEPAA